MRPIEPLSKVGAAGQPSLAGVTVMPPVASGPVIAQVAPEPVADTTSLSETAAIVHRLRNSAASQGTIRPDVVAQIRHDLSMRRSDRTADIERAICRLLNEL